jgi:hypothetical protein
VSHAFNEKNDTFKIISTVATCFLFWKLYHFDIHSFEGGGEKENTEFWWKSISLSVLKNIENDLLSSIAKRRRNGLAELQKKYAPYVRNRLVILVLSTAAVMWHKMKCDRIIVRKWSCLERLIEAMENLKVSARV